MVYHPPEWVQLWAAAQVCRSLWFPQWLIWSHSEPVWEAKSTHWKKKNKKRNKEAALLCQVICHYSSEFADRSQEHQQWDNQVRRNVAEPWWGHSCQLPSVWCCVIQSAKRKDCAWGGNCWSWHGHWKKSLSSYTLGAHTIWAGESKPLPAWLHNVLPSSEQNQPYHQKPSFAGLIASTESQGILPE